MVANYRKRLITVTCPVSGRSHSLSPARQWGLSSPNAVVSSSKQDGRYYWQAGAGRVVSQSDSHALFVDGYPRWGGVGVA